LFLHRKLGGLYLLFSRLGACIPVREQVLSALAMPHAPEHGNKPATVDEG
jgi:hypothetical protein